MMKKTSGMSNLPASQKGFTLVELLVAMTISLIVMAAIYSTYRSQQNSYIIQDQVSVAQQNLRAAMYTMTRDIRMAGYDPTYTTKPPRRTTFGITVAKTNTLTFTSDLNEDGDATEANETIVYSLDANNNLTRDEGGGPQTLAENIVAMGFAYAYDNNGDYIMDMSANNHIIWAIDSNNDGKLDLSLDTNDNGVIDATDDTDSNGTINGTSVGPILITKIKSVKIWLLARTDKRISGYNDATRYVVGNSIPTLESGYMYRLLTETAKCRNL